MFVGDKANTVRGISFYQFFVTVNQTKLLLDAGADVNALDKKGCSALSYASDGEQISLIEEALNKFL